MDGFFLFEFVLLMFVVLVGAISYLQKRRRERKIKSVLPAARPKNNSESDNAVPRTESPKIILSNQPVKKVSSEKAIEHHNREGHGYQRTPLTYSPIPEDLFERACEIIERKYSRFPIECRGILIQKKLVKATLEILNSVPGKILPQNCRNDIREKTPDGLDLRIKEYLDSDLRTANIITDLLENVGIVSNIQVINDKTGRLVKGSQLNPSWCW